MSANTPRDAADSTRGWGPWGRKWYSICSRHGRGRYDVSCRLCVKGHWVNNWAHAVGHTFYVIAPDLWRVWANRGRGWRNAWKNRKV